MINRRFINFKKYNTFLQKRNEIPEDAVVFIQDKLCIWARGKEYICDGPNQTRLANKTLTFSSGSEEAVFTITLDGGTLTFKDTDGNTSSATYILKSQFDGKIEEIDYTIGKLADDIYKIIDQLPYRSELHQVAFTGLYDDLEGAPEPITVDSELTESSSRPVASSAIYAALRQKINRQELDNYTTKNAFTEGLDTKQNKFKAGRGLEFLGQWLNCILDTEIYVIVDELGNPEDADPNKIYILETKIGDDYRYQQYRVKNNQWIPVGEMSPSVNLDGYLTKSAADEFYQPIGNYLTSIDLLPYALEADLDQLRLNLSNYALIEYVLNNYQTKGNYAYKDYVDNTFVKRSEVYNPKQGDWGTDGSGEGGSGVTPIINYTITVDSDLSFTSENPVLNQRVTRELDIKANKSLLLEYARLEQLESKADKSQLNNYVTSNHLTEVLADKQDVLTAGEGISIINNVISANLDIDTSVYLFVDELPATNINDDKIYILGEEENEQITYTQWKHQDGEWIPIGQLQANIDLSNYITRSDAANTFAPKGNYVTAAVLEAFRQTLEDLYQKKGNYVTLTYADATYQPKGNYLTSVDLTPYAKVTDLDDYASKLDLQDLSNFVELTYLKLIAIYTPTDGSTENGSSSSTENGGSSSSDSSTPSGGGDTPNNPTIINNNTTVVYDIEVDSELSLTSSNPVENRIVKRELDKKANIDALSNYALKTELFDKADKSLLNDYATSAELLAGLNTKQNTLSAGSGIEIDENNQISVSLDTNPFIIVSELPTTNINPNKIYLLEEIVDGETTYTEYRRLDGTWVEIGLKDISIDLSDYIKESDADAKYLIAEGTYLTPQQAANLYQAKGNDYALASVVDATYQKKGDYVSNEDFEAMRINVESVFLKKGNYADISDVNAAIRLLQQVIDQKYVLKQDVYKPQAADFSQGDIANITVGDGSGNSGEQGGGGISVTNMVTLTVEQYQYLVNANLVQENTYYFTYEGEPENTTWHFGDTFPIILTDGSTPDSIGTFPINLT